MKDFEWGQEGQDLKTGDPNKKNQYKETSNHSSHSVQHCHCWLCGKSRYCCLSMSVLWAVTHWHTCLSQLSQGTHSWRHVGVHVFIYRSLGYIWAQKIVLLLALTLFLHLSSTKGCYHTPPQVVMCFWRLCGRISSPVLSVCVLTAPSCSTQLAGHRQPMECSTNCAGHRGYAASLSLSARSASASLA